MVEERLADGIRIAQLLASEVEGRSDGVLEELSVTAVDAAVEPTDDGAFAYAISADESRLAEVYVHPDRAHVEFATGHEAVVAAAETEGLRVRPKAVRPPKTLVFVEDGAGVKRAIAVIERATRSD
ncbi:MAG: hypothetical protein QXG03_03055 [Halalkalicoccus sp.]